METRTAQPVLQFALNRESGQENERAINTQLNRNPLNPSIKYPTSHPTRETKHTTKHPDPAYPHGTSNHHATPLSRTHADDEEYNLHRNIYKYAQPRKSNATYAKKIGHYSKVCRSAKPNKQHPNKAFLKPDGYAT